MNERRIDELLGGAVTFWAVPNPADLDALKREWPAWPESLVACLPEPTTSAAALKRALDEVLASRSGDARLLVRPVDAKKGVFAVVRERVREVADWADALDYEVASTVAVQDGGGLDIHGGLPVAWSTLREAYDKHLAQVPGHAVGRALVKAVEALSGVALRDSGGVYWVSACRLDTWERVARAVETTCEKASVYMLRAPVDAQTARAVIDAVVADANSSAAAIERDMGDGSLGKRALQGRVKSAGEMLAKVREYEALFGTSLDTLRARIESVEMAATMAALAVQDDIPGVTRAAS